MTYWVLLLFDCIFGFIIYIINIAIAIQPLKSTTNSGWIEQAGSSYKKGNYPNGKIG